VLGGGKGIVHHFGLQGKFDVEMAPSARRSAVMGGVIAGKTVAIDYMRQKARRSSFPARHSAGHGGLPGCRRSAGREL